jgi:integrase
MAERPGVAGKRERLGDPEVRRWYENVARGSQVTADNYLRSLFNFSSRTGLTPAGVAKLDGRRVHHVLLDFVSGEEKRGMTGSTVLTYVKAVRSWLAHHGKKVERPIKIRGAERSPTLADERVPTQDELRAILLAATPQQRVAVALMGFAGLRPEVLGNYPGKDGLRVSDLPDLTIKGNRVEFERMPAMVRVRDLLSKTRASYFSFIGAEGARYITEYLEQRIRDGEKVGPASDVLHLVWARKPFMKSTKVSEAVKRAIVKAGFSWRPYVLRAYFDTQMLMAESKGKVAHDYRVFWMGHKGSIESRYTTNKGRLPASFVDDMREAYHRCEPFLSTVNTEAPVSEADIKKAILAVFLPEDEIAKVDVTKLSADDVRKLVGDRLRGSQDAVTSLAAWTLAPHAPQNGNGGSNGSGLTLEAVVPLADVKTRLAEGWTWVASLGATDAILRRPNHDGDVGLP